MSSGVVAVGKALPPTTNVPSAVTRNLHRVLAGPGDAPGHHTGRCRADEGVATVWAAMAVAVMMIVLVASLHLGAAILARHRAESAADLAALAAARQAVRGEAAACREAASVAGAAGGTVTRCLLAGWDALVEVRMPVAVALPGLDSAVGQAMAGPEQTEPGPRTYGRSLCNSGSASGRSSPTDGPHPGACPQGPPPVPSSAFHRCSRALIVDAAPIGDTGWPHRPCQGLLEQVSTRRRPGQEP
jgi:secretion/DNA translocation related TadE-like protein